MAQRKDPAGAVVHFFQTAPTDTAATVLAICKSILARRQKKLPRVGVTDHTGAGAGVEVSDAVERLASAQSMTRPSGT